MKVLSLKNYQSTEQLHTSARSTTSIHLWGATRTCCPFVSHSRCHRDRERLQTWSCCHLVALSNSAPTYHSSTAGRVQLMFFGQSIHSAFARYRLPRDKYTVDHRFSRNEHWMQHFVSTLTLIRVTMLSRQRISLYLCVSLQNANLLIL